MKMVAIRCYGVVGIDNKNMLASVAIVDEDLKNVYKTFVAPTQAVVDYKETGIFFDDLKRAPSFSQVQQRVKSVISGCLLIGHCVDDDLKLLKLNHPEHNIRDVALYPPFRKYNNDNRPSLKMLAHSILGASSIEESFTGRSPEIVAATVMKMYKHVANQIGSNFEDILF